MIGSVDNCVDLVVVESNHPLFICTKSANYVSLTPVPCRQVSHSRVGNGCVGVWGESGILSVIKQLGFQCRTHFKSLNANKLTQFRIITIQAWRATLSGVVCLTLIH